MGIISKGVKKFSPLFITAAVAGALAAFLIFPARYAKEVRDGIALWAVSVLPATLPLLFLTAIFTKLKLFGKVSGWLTPLSRALFGVSGTGAATALLSAVSGYPVGARAVYDLTEAGLLPKEERFRTAAISTTTGPAFLVGAVGAGIFHSAKIGWILFAAHLIGVYFVGILLRLGAKPLRTAPAPAAKRSEEISVGKILESSVLSVLCVGGAIAIFYAFGAIAEDIGAALRLPDGAIAVFKGLLEMTTGCAAVAGKTTPIALAECAFFVTFGGFCVLLQQLAFLGRADIKTAPFLAVKFAQGAVAALAAFLFSLLL